MTADRVAIGEQPWVKEAMQELAPHVSSMWVPWGDVAGSCANTWDRRADTFAGKPPAWLSPPRGPSTVDQTAVRVLEMVVLEPDMPDWGDDDDVEEIIPAIPVPPAVPRPPAQPSCRWMGSSFGCGPRGRAVG